MYEEETKICTYFYLNDELYEKDVFSLVDMDILPEFYPSSQAIERAIEQFTQSWSESFYDELVSYDKRKITPMTEVTFALLPLKKRTPLFEKVYLLKELKIDPHLYSKGEHLFDAIYQRFYAWEKEVVRTNWQVMTYAPS